MHTLGLVLGMGGETLRDKFRLTNTAMITGTVSVLHSLRRIPLCCLG